MLIDLPSIEPGLAYSIDADEVVAVEDLGLEGPIDRNPERCLVRTPAFAWIVGLPREKARERINLAKIYGRDACPS